MTNPDRDPFNREKTPSISFNNEPIGTVKSLTVTEYATTAQARDFKTKELDYWKNKDGSTSPKMNAILNGVDENGQPIALFAQIPSNLMAAISDAQAAIEKGYRIKPGDKVSVQFYGEEPTDASPRKLYRAKVTPGVAPPPVADDPWASTPAAPPAQSGFDDEPPF